MKHKIRDQESEVRGQCSDKGVHPGLFPLPNPVNHVNPVKFLLRSKFHFFFINSSTAEVIALTPVRSVGSGRG
jgi:hypothetical protein